MTTFSVIVPVYNAKCYLRQALDSIQHQTYPNYEVIMVDDGSTDGSGQICDEYAEKDNRFKVIHQPNSGVTRARKTGIRNVNCEYVIWVDADDYIGADMLEKLNGIIEKYLPDMVAFGFTCISSSGKKHFTKINELEAEKLYTTEDKAFFKNLIYDKKKNFGNGGDLNFELWDKAIKKEIVYDCLLAVPNELRIGEDMATVFTAIQKCTTVYVSEMSDYYYRLNDASIMHTFKADELRRFEILFNFLSNNRGEIPQENIDLYMIKEVLNHMLSAIAEHKDYLSYSTYVKTEISPIIREVIDRTKIPKCSVKQFVQLLLQKHYCYLGFWILIHTRKKIKECIYCALHIGNKSECERRT